MTLTPPGISPTGVPTQYVVVWEWENRPRRWRPYTPEASQLIERAHNKKLNKFYLKDADPALADFNINMPAFEQVCESTGVTYPVRREFYASSGPAGKGSRWEWAGDAAADDWHTYDMEVQEVLEDSWHQGDQTIDISKHLPGCPYIINFCNMTQVRNNGVVRSIRRVTQRAYPMVKLTQAEIASMIHRKEERRQEMLLELERRQKSAQQAKKKKRKDFSKDLVAGLSSEKSKKAVKHLMNQIFHHKADSASQSSSSKDKKDFENLLRRKSASGSASSPFMPLSKSSQKASLSASSHNLSSAASLATDPAALMLPPHSRSASGSGGGHHHHLQQQQQQQQQAYQQRRGASAIGHPSEASHPLISRRAGGAPAHFRAGSTSGYGRYRRMQPDASYSSFSDNGSSIIIRRPSCDTISTYLSGESSMLASRGVHRSSYYGGSFGSQELLNVYGDEDSVFDDYPGPGDSVSMVGATTTSSSQGQLHNATVDGSSGLIGFIGARPKLDSYHSATLSRLPFPPTRGAVATPQRQRVLSDPALDMLIPPPPPPSQLPGGSRSRNSSLSREPRASHHNGKPAAGAGGSLYCNIPSPPGVQPNLNGLVEDLSAGLYVNQRELKDDVWSTDSTSPPQSPGRRQLTSSQLSLGPPSGLSALSARRALFSSQDSISHCREISAVSGISPPMTPTRNAPLKKRPVPTPRTILNTTSSSQTDAVSAHSSSTCNTVVPSSIESLILRYAQFIGDAADPQEACLICHVRLQEPSPCQETERRLVCLTLCHHKFHLACLESLVENQPGGANYLECAACHTISGEKWGDMPPTGGTMTYKIVPKALPGYSDYHTIQITYNFTNGTQGGNHPMPGQPYFAIGFPKTAFLPDTENGRRVLVYLETAFNRRLTFTITRDPSTGQEDVLDWSPALEHKTEWGPSESGKAYPDQEYLERVLGQLGMLGIVQQEHDV